ncbi:MAG: TolC family protein [Lentisphaerae bacterium]|nr:TolC family protein [Lentisphaerota bacterium]
MMIEIFRGLRVAVLLSVIVPSVRAGAATAAPLPSDETGHIRMAQHQAGVPDALPLIDESTTLRDYLAYAALNNAGLRADFSQWKAALERIPQVKSLPDPRFNYAYFIEEVETRVGPQRQKFGLAQTFPWFGTLRLRGDAAGEAAAAAQQSYEKTKLQLFFRVKAAYYEYWYLAQALTVTREHIQLVANLEGVTRTRFKAGAEAYSSVVQAQVELGKLDDQLRTLESLREPIVATLNAAMNRPTQLPLPWPRSLPELVASFTDTQALAWLAESNPDLLRLDHLVAKEDVGIELARKSYYPDVTLGVDYGDMDEARNSGVSDSGKDPVVAMVSINLPIWYGKYRAEAREARLRKKAAEGQREDVADRLAADVKLLLYHFHDAERKIDLYGDTLVPKAEQSLEATQQGFEAGSTPFISLIDAQRMLLEFQLAHQRSQADRGRRLAEIEAIVGREAHGRAIRSK